MRRAALDAATDAAGPDPVDRLAAAGTAYVEFASNHWPRFELMFRLDAIDPSDPHYARAAAAAHHALVDAVGAAQDAGWATGRAAEDLVALCWALVHGFAALTAPGGPAAAGADTARLIRLQLDAFDDPAR